VGFPSHFNISLIHFYVKNTENQLVFEIHIRYIEKIDHKNLEISKVCRFCNFLIIYLVNLSISINSPFFAIGQ